MDKAFFFADYQGTRQKIGTSLLQNVPTALVRSTCLAPALHAATAVWRQDQLLAHIALLHKQIKGTIVED